MESALLNVGALNECFLVLRPEDRSGRPGAQSQCYFSTRNGSRVYLPPTSFE
jgi:hypothetical protein